MNGPPVGMLLVACILDTRLLLGNSDVKVGACGKGKGAVRKRAQTFAQRRSAQSLRGWEHGAAPFQPRHGLVFVP